jgi:hypothetical protein
MQSNSRSRKPKGCVVEFKTLEFTDDRGIRALRSDFRISSLETVLKKRHGGRRMRDELARIQPPVFCLECVELFRANLLSMLLHLFCLEI